MSLLQNSNAIESGGYTINNSLRFRADAGAYLNRTPASASNRKTWTWSGWVKRGQIGTYVQAFMDTIGSSTDSTFLRFGFGIITDNTFSIDSWSSFSLITTQVFRDPSAWYHIVLAFDTTQATASNRVKLYVNGSQVTSFSTATYPTLNADYGINNNTAHEIGRYYLPPGAQNLFDGYMAEVNFIDGQQLTPSSFGETDGTTSVWKPKKYTGTYGTNGFYLPFTASSLSGFSSYSGSFNGSSKYLTATLPSTLSGQFTIEAFIKPTVEGFNPLFTLGDSSLSTGLEWYFGGGSTPSVWGNNTFQIQGDEGVITAGTWAHVAITRDASNVIRMFINGAQVGGTWTTTNAFSNTLRIGVEYYSSAINSYMDGAISNFRIVTGNALYTSNFTPPTSALTAVSGTQILTLQNATIIDNSTNALSITNTGSVATSSGTIGNFTYGVTRDYSGSNNNWDSNYISLVSGTTYDAMIDSPTNTNAGTQPVGNYAVLNPLFIAGTYINANLKYNASSNFNPTLSTIAIPTTGQFYAEATVTGTPFGTAQSNAYAFFGITPTSRVSGTSPWSDGNALFVTDVGWRYNFVAYSSGTDLGSAFANGDVIGLAVDTGANTFAFYKNGSSIYSGTIGITAGTQLSYMANNYDGNNGTMEINFGQRPFAYTPPSGYKALCTTNLPDSTIVQGNKYMDATLYTGTGSSLSVTNTASFKPDLVWIKGRSNAFSNNLTDSNRGVLKALLSDTTGAEANLNGAVSAFNSNGFSVATGSSGIAEVSNNGSTYVGWQWQAGQGTTSSNTSGTITSTVSVNATAGFSIVSYTETSGSYTVGHGLGVTPSMFILKERNTSSNWIVWHKYWESVDAIPTKKGQYLNGTNASFTTGSDWLNSLNSSTIGITAGQVTGGTDPTVIYCFAEIAGYSKFGSYTGNGSTDGPFVYLGFRPKFVMIKANGIADWCIFDTSRNSYNVANYSLYADSSGAEQTLEPIDILSNGFKTRTTAGNVNNNGTTYIYMAFAENPFGVNCRAR